MFRDGLTLLIDFDSMSVISTHKYYIDRNQYNTFGTFKIDNHNILDAVDTAVQSYNEKLKTDKNDRINACISSGMNYDDAIKIENNLYEI